MEDEKSRVDLSSLTVDEDDDEEISTEEETDDEDENSTDEDDGDEYETSSEEEDDGDGADAGPPIHFAEDLASPPEWILLEIQGYIDARKNSTTAFACLSKGGGAIQVTFWAARPPRVSCFTVHWDGVNPSDRLPQRPTVLAAEDDLVLLRVDRNDEYYIMEYFVYQAAGATSTLRLLADPPAYVGSNEAGILRLPDGEFLVAVLCVVGGPYCGKYDLHQFDSRTWTWTSREMMRVDRFARVDFRPTKVLGIGGERGSMAWVDLWQGMLVCNLVTVHDDDANTLGYIRLPPSNAKPEGCQWPSTVRDMAVVQGRVIKFFEMRFKVKERAITSTAALVTRYWKAATWEKKTDDPWQPSWRKDCGLDIFKVPVDKTHPELPPRLHDMGKLHGEHPALSLHEEDVVYIMAKAKVSDRRRAWMLAVDMRNKTLREVAAFDAGRAYSYNSYYLQSRLSSYLKIQSST